MSCWQASGWLMSCWQASGWPTSGWAEVAMQMEFGCWERWPAGGMRTGIPRYAMKKAATAEGLDDAGGPTTEAKSSRERELRLLLTALSRGPGLAISLRTSIRILAPATDKKRDRMAAV